jgi:hypothetical protein
MPKIDSPNKRTSPARNTAEGSERRIIYAYQHSSMGVGALAKRFSLSERQIKKVLQVAGVYKDPRERTKERGWDGMAAPYQ